MKVILYMATSANGLVAGLNDDISWISEDQRKSHKRFMEKVQCVVIGRKTYDIMTPDRFIDGKKYLVYSNKKENNLKISNVEFTSIHPRDLITFLETEGVESICVCGGSAINTLFIKEGLIDEIYLDIEPIMLNQGNPLFNFPGKTTHLELLESKQLSKNTIQLHYRVQK